MNWLKVLTRSGRQDLARQAAKAALTPDALASWTSKAVNDTLMRSLTNVDDAKLGNIVRRCQDGADLFKAVATAVEDKTITPEEATEIYQRIAALTSGVITQERADMLIEKVVSLVP